MPRTVESAFDAAIVDKDNHAVALIQVKAHPVDNWAELLPIRVENVAEQVAFVLAIDPIHIYLFRPEGEDIGEPIAHLDTRLILQHYDSDFSRKRVFESYLLTLVEAWLRDLAYHWKSESPPGAVELEGVGLLERLEGGTTQRLGA